MEWKEVMGVCGAVLGGLFCIKVRSGIIRKIKRTEKNDPESGAGH